MLIITLCLCIYYSEDIVDYVMVHVPPSHPSLPRPRFSLYLSSQLQYGVVIVYHRQCAFLLGEIVVLSSTVETLTTSVDCTVLLNIYSTKLHLKTAVLPKPIHTVKNPL